MKEKAMSWNYIAASFQLIFTGWFIFTHWISLPSLNNLDQEAFPHERGINLTLHVLQITSAIGFFLQIDAIMWLGIMLWSISMIGHLISWWTPYFFGWPSAFLKNAEIDNKKTYHFLPARKNYPIPDLNHCIIGALVFVTTVTTWIAFFDFKN
jgi:hypothetical protein